MKRAELYRVYRGSPADPKRSRVFAVVSRQVVIDSSFSTVICAPICASFTGLSTQVRVGVSEGFKHESSIHCDELVSIRKSALTDYVGRLDMSKRDELDRALQVALDIA